MSDCCNKTADASALLAAHRRTSRGISRRAVLARMSGLVGGVAALAAVPAYAKNAGRDKVTLAFCSQLLCVVPYEVTRAAGFFADEGLDVQLVYSRGGSAALQALHSGGVDYAATSFDAALGAYANGANIVRFAATGRLPLFALASSPGMAGNIVDVAALEGRTIGVAQLGNADHALALFLLKRAGVNIDSVQFATLGPNLFDALRLGQVDAGMVQEPGLSLLQEAGARVLVNLMDLKDANTHLGGPYAFMGVALRRDEVSQRSEQMRRIGRALTAGLLYTRQTAIDEVVQALPDELVAGGDTRVLTSALGRYRESLYPSRVTIDRAACQRVIDTQRLAGIQDDNVDLDGLLDLSILAEA